MTAPGLKMLPRICSHCPTVSRTRNSQGALAEPEGWAVVTFARQGEPIRNVRLCPVCAAACEKFIETFK